MKSRKFKVYLGGPISGCNERQMKGWRETVIEAYSGSFEFINPAEDLLGERAPYKYVESGLRNFERADGLLVNMWRESIGTAIGIVHAHRAGRMVVVSDPNHIENKILEFYADAVETSPLEAASALLNLLRASTNWTVIKRESRGSEYFDTKKLMSAIRAACRDAGKDDIVVPRLVVSEVIKLIKDKDNRPNKRKISSTQINEYVLTYLDTRHAMVRDISDISKHWKNHYLDKQTSSDTRHKKDTRDIRSRAHVEMSCAELNSTIWGYPISQLSDIPGKPRLIFKCIQETRGVTKVVFGRFGRGMSGSSCCAAIKRSRKRFVLDGILYNEGNWQGFDVWVQFSSERNIVVKEIREKLKEMKLLSLE